MAGKLAVTWILWEKKIWDGNLGMIMFEAAADWWPYSNDAHVFIAKPPPHLLNRFSAVVTSLSSETIVNTQKKS